MSTQVPEPEVNRANTILLANSANGAWITGRVNGISRIAYRSFWAIVPPAVPYGIIL